MRYPLLPFLLLFVFVAKAQVDPAALDSLRSSIAEQTREQRARQDSSVKKAREAQSLPARPQAAQKASPDNDTFVWWIAGLGAGAGLAYLFTRRRNKRTS